MTILRSIHMKSILAGLSLLLSASWAHAQGYSDSISVNFFLLDECIITINMTPEINRIYADFRDDFQFTGYFPNRSTTPENRQKFVEKYKLELPVKSDYFKKQSQRLGATVAPQVVVYDEKQERILYSGRINNLYEAVGNRRKKPSIHDLEQALQSINDNQAIINSKTQAVGCLINFKE